MSLHSVFLCLLGAVAVVACGSPPAMPDAGADGGFDAAVEVDAGPPLTCASVMELTGLVDETVTVSFDTSMTLNRPRDLGLVCGNTSPELRWAPQEVVHFTVPGDSGSLYAVEVSTDQPGTSANFDTVVQIRDTCETAPQGAFPPRCFNDIASGQYRTRGSVTVAGGSELFVIVTGFSEPAPEQMTVDSGTVEVSFTVTQTQRPTIASGFLRLVEGDTLVRITGTDPDGDVRGVGINFYTDGEVIDIYGDGVASEDGDVFVVPFDGPAATGTDWTGGARVAPNLAAVLRGRMATHARFRVFDSAWGVSESFEVPIEEGTLVGLGEMCGAETYCRSEMVCSSGACIAGSMIGALCGGATTIAVPATAEMGATLTQTGASGSGLGVITVDPSCVADPNGSAGAEAVYRVDVAVDNFDLTLTTDLPGTGSTDTIMYVRSMCPDSGSVLGCNDDAAPMNFQSQIMLTDLTAGTYYVFVEAYGGVRSGSAPHALQVTVTPVIASGAACDAATTRCASGTCTAGMCT